MRSLYSLGIRIYGIGILIYSLFNKKAKQWVEGRKNWKASLRDAGIEGAIWIHCASLGEFEQGRPVIEGIKKRFPEKKLLLTFFSPSGYEVRKNYPNADYVCYLPLDTRRNAKTFIELVQPELVLFVKYEVWHNFFYELLRSGVPHYIISAIFRADQIYFKNYGSWFRRTLTRVTKIFTQDKTSLQLLQKFGINHADFAGDTRFDRVFEISQKSEKLPKAEQFTRGKITLVAGSTWPADEKILSEVMSDFKELNLIIAPHEVSEKHIRNLRELFPKSLLWSEPNTESDELNTLIIDRIGLLSSLYASGQIAYVGGGFGAGIHNTLEPACFGIPVLFGPKFSKFKEATDLIAMEGAFSISDTQSLRSQLSEIVSNKSFRESAGTLCAEYVDRSRGGTEKILREIID